MKKLAARLSAPTGPLELPENLRRAAVLVIICQDDDRLWIPLIQRPPGQGVHGGQIALPGGAVDPADRDLLATALREAHEEIGVEIDSLTVLGRLPAVVVRVSGFIVVPFVAWTAARPLLTPSQAEVAGIVELPLSLLVDPGAVRETPNPPGSLHPTMFEYPLPEGRLWGATARMLHSLGAVLAPLAGSRPLN